MNRETCSERIYGDRSVHGYACSKPVKVHDDQGHPWCAIHSPEAKARKKARELADRTAKRTAEREHRAETAALIDRLYRLLPVERPNIVEAWSAHQAKEFSGYTGSITISRDAARAIIERLSR